MELVIGIAIGAAFAPFWMMVYDKFIKPVVAKIFPPKQ